MPRLLSLPLSELFTESSGAASSEYFPSPWHGAPLPIALKARQLAEDAALFMLKLPVPFPYFLH